MVVKVLKYIGPFLRMNLLKNENIENQLFHLSKEAIYHIVLNSKCGIVIPFNQLKIKNIPNSDINTFKSFSPLLCVYKKANPKLVLDGTHYCWDIDTFKSDIDIWSNAAMTLSIMELYRYYSKLKEKDVLKYNIGSLYYQLSKKQLEFFATYLRNEDGVFVDKKHIRDLTDKDLNFEDESKKFKYSSQALLMAAFYRCATINPSKLLEDYKNFSFDILKMLLRCKGEIYCSSMEELIKLCFALNLFYKYSKCDEEKPLLLDIWDIIEENLASVSKIEYKCFCAINSMLLYKNTGFLKYKAIYEDLIKELMDYYDNEKYIFNKGIDVKEIKYSSEEIVLYLICMLMYFNENNTEEENIPVDIFKQLVINSGIILSWPDAPNLDDVERYAGFCCNAESLIDEQNFRLPSMPIPEKCELAPIFIKNVIYNIKKDSFEKCKATFDSSVNFILFFLILLFETDKHILS